MDVAPCSTCVLSGLLRLSPRYPRTQSSMEHRTAPLTHQNSLMRRFLIRQLSLSLSHSDFLSIASGIRKRVHAYYLHVYTFWVRPGERRYMTGWPFVMHSLRGRNQNAYSNMPFATSLRDIDTHRVVPGCESLNLPAIRTYFPFRSPMDIFDAQ